jgi:peptide/nickel transport system ATP-binding protein
MPEPILSIRDLCVDYITEKGPVRAVDQLSLDVHRGEILGVAGESGSGKSTLAQAILRILPPPAVITGGSVRFDGTDVLALDEGGLRALRWTRMSIVFQSAMDALNPVLTVGEQIMDTMQARRALDHQGVVAQAPVDALNPVLTVGEQIVDTVEARPYIGRQGARERAAELLRMVGIAPDILTAYAHQLSGGMRQRVGIALALALEPSLVILDEPTTALDVIVERDILAEIRTLQRRLGFAVLFITHDLSRMLQFSDRVSVFYAARLVEVGPVAEMHRAPLHPYTQGLLKAFPTVHGGSVELASIPGSPASLEKPPAGCRFHPRCERAIARCSVESPGLTQIGEGHAAACHLVP